MTPGAGREEHWLDRLAAPHTRRHGFKAAFAAAALTVPLARPRYARAGNPNSNGDAHACQKGCLYSSQRQALQTLNKCSEVTRTGYNHSMAVTLMFSPLLGLVAAAGNMVALEVCGDAALLAQKDRGFKCHEANCPGFDPKDEYGPCRNCASINGCQCCPDSSAPTGYTYCSSLSNYCCNPGGGCRVCGT